MKRFVLLGLLALSFLATARTVGNKSELPLPTCSPCPFVR